MLRHAPALTVALLLVPIAAGLAGTALPAFGILPALGRTTPSLEPWRELLAWPGLATALALTVASGIAATILSLALAAGICAACHGTRWFRRAEAALAPLLATPAAALAIGFAFLVAPSGWAFRLLSPWATGLDRPPDLATVNDELGLALVAGLALKETPYLMLMIAAALGQAQAERGLAVARGLGYRPLAAWFKAVFPRVYPQIRLPVYAVLAYSLSVVDVALILGPNSPPPLSPLVVRWFADRDVALYFPAAAGACLQFAIVAAAIGGWRLAEVAAARLGRIRIAAGRRGGGGEGMLRALGALLLATCAAALVVLPLWSFAASWRFPAALPEAWTTATWARLAGEVAGPAWTTIACAGAATLVALALALACLENEQRRGLRPSGRALWLLYIPLLVPQVAFLFGAEVALVRLGLDGSFAALVWAHLLFVLPYVFLGLADPWRALDPRYARAAACLGAGPARTFWRVKLPILLRPLLTAASVGFAVSVGLYLPTLFAGGGRHATLTTEAVTLSAGGDRRVVAVYALAQAALPFMAYLLSVLVPGQVRSRGAVG
jgi:putative thiamine transport system permease protein